jgi:hypothetical protein
MGPNKLVQKYNLLVRKDGNQLVVAKHGLSVVAHPSSPNRLGHNLLEEEGLPRFTDYSFHELISSLSNRVPANVILSIGTRLIIFSCAAACHVIGCTHAWEKRNEQFVC